MALIYEHWRPDKQECFYVGASCVGENRANDFSPRNDRHRKVLDELKENGIAPFSVIVWENLPDDCVGCYEKMRISYQKSVFNSGITNISLGGVGLNLEWTDELKEKLKSAIKIAFNKTEYKELQSKIQKEVQNIPEINAKRSRSLILANSDPEVRKRKSIAAKKAHAKPGAKEARMVRESFPELKEKRKNAARLGGLKAGKKSAEELSNRGKKAAETRRLRALQLGELTNDKRN